MEQVHVIKAAYKLIPCMVTIQFDPPLQIDRKREICMHMRELVLKKGVLVAIANSIVLGKYQ